MVFCNPGFVFSRRNCSLFLNLLHNDLLTPHTTNSNAPVIWNPHLLHPRHGGDIHSVWVWKPVKFPDTGAKILSEVPVPGYPAVQTKEPCVESAVIARLSYINPLDRPSRACLRRENVTPVAASYANNLCQMFTLPSGAKVRPLTNQMWIPRSYAKKLAWFLDGSKLPAHFLPWTTSSRLKIRLRSESECSSRPSGNTSWWIWGSWHFLILFL